MGLDLSAEDIAVLEERTEGWIAGLQLAAISMRGHRDTTSFIESFTGSHRFVLDYLVEEVLGQQSEGVQTFLLRTSILDRMCGPLCDAVLLDPSASGQETLEYLERVNLFLVPLDDERRWYRYHHLFAELLRQRLHQSAVSSTGHEKSDVAELHIRASAWCEDNGLEIEAFQHAAAVNDVERAERLIDGYGMPLHFRGAVAPVLDWLESLPTTVLDGRPSLWARYASTLLAVGQVTGVEQKLQAAEAALQGAESDDETQDLIGRIAAVRAALAVTQHQVETIVAQSHRALEYLHPDNLFVRTAANWTLGYAYQLQGDRTAASRAYTEVISIGQTSGNVIFTITATVGLGSLQEADNQLYLAAQTYRRGLQQFGDPPPRVACRAHLGLARICYEWNDMDAAEQHGQQGVQLARQIENTDGFIACEVFLARLELARGSVAGAAALLDEAREFVRQHNLVNQVPEVSATQVLALLHQGDLAAAARLTRTYELPTSQARVYLARGEASTALAALEPLRRQAETEGRADERLKVMVLQTVALHAHGEKDEAVHLLGEALSLAEPGGFIRTFVDEGIPMARLLYDALSEDVAPEYIRRLLAAYPVAEPEQAASSRSRGTESGVVEPLSERELEVLQLIAEGLTNQEVASRLYLSLHTVKVHARNIFTKLAVNNRAQASAKGRALGILSQT